MELLLKGILEIGVPLKWLESSSIYLEREKGGILIILQYGFSFEKLSSYILRKKFLIIELSSYLSFRELRAFFDV